MSGRAVLPPANPVAPHPRGQRGFALIAVLWILVLLTAIAGAFAYSMRTEVNIARNFKEATQAHYIAQAGLQRTVLELLRLAAAETPAGDGAEAEIWRINLLIPAQAFANGEYSARIDNAAGLIDLNTASDALLRLLVGMLDIGDRERAVIADSILDWRDADDLHRLHGAEDGYYRSLPDGYDCKDGPFDAVEELLLVRGMTPDLFARLRPALIVLPPQDAITGRASARAAPKESGRINVNAAPPHLLAALPEMSPEQTESLVDFRAEADFRSLEEVRAIVGPATFSAISPYISLTLSPYYSIRVEGRLTGSRVRQNLSAAVRLDEKLPLGYEIVSWQEQFY